MRRPTLSVSLSLVVASLALLLFLPRPCGACMPSGGPSEILFLHLDSVRVNGDLVDVSPYGVEHMHIEGVGDEFFLWIRQEAPKAGAEFGK